MAAANAWLPGFTTAYNARFGRDPANTKDLHRPLAQADDLPPNNLVALGLPSKGRGTTPRCGRGADLIPTAAPLSSSTRYTIVPAGEVTTQSFQRVRSRWL